MKLAEQTINARHWIRIWEHTHITRYNTCPPTLSNAYLRFDSATDWFFIELKPFRVEKTCQLQVEFSAEAEEFRWKKGMYWDFLELRQVLPKLQASKWKWFFNKFPVHWVVKRLNYYWLNTKTADFCISSNDFNQIISKKLNQRIESPENIPWNYRGIKIQMQFIEPFSWFMHTFKYNKYIVPSLQYQSINSKSI